MDMGSESWRGRSVLRTLPMILVGTGSEWWNQPQNVPEKQAGLVALALGLKAWA
jgi:hypothetical protein